MNALLISLTLVSLLLWRDRGRDRYLLLAAFLAGLCLTHHLTSGLLLPASLLFRGPSPYYRVGEIEVPGSPGAAKVPVGFEAAAGEPPLIGRVLGTETRAYLGRIAATPLGDRERVPLSDVCGRYLDWYEPDRPGAPAAAGIEAPTLREPQEDGRDG